MYTSNASWTKIEDSQDTHSTKDDAILICNLLMDDYSRNACDTRGNVIKCWAVNEETKEIIYTIKNRHLEELQSDSTSQ